MPKPFAAFVMPPVTIDFNNGVSKTVSVRITPLSTKPFHVIFSLDYEPLLFDGSNSKVLEFSGVDPKTPYSDAVYDFPIAIRKTSGAFITEELACYVITDAGRSDTDEINITVS